MEAAVVDLESVQQAQRRIAPFARRTPLIPSRYLTELAGGNVYLKAEALQHTGSFKIRGAANRLALLTPEERRRGVVAASAGNHGQGVAVVAASLGIDCTVIMPVGASLAKIQAIKGYGARVVLHDEPFAHAKAIAEERNLVFIHAFDDPAVIAGQGTIGLEIVEDLPEVAQVIVPTGGGGLASGVAVAVKTLCPQLRIVGVQAAAAPAVAQSFHQGKPLSVRPRPTLADGAALAEPGRITFPLLRRYLDDIVVVDEEAIAQAIALLLERSKLVAEGAGALGVAALLRGLAPAASGPTVVVLSGGNIDISLLARVAEHGLSHAGRYLSIAVGLEDQPGRLAELLAIISATGANVLEVEHHRWGLHLGVGRVQAVLIMEVRDKEHAQQVCSDLESAGYAEVPREGPEAQRYFLPQGWLDDKDRG
ncbi:MAG: threonine ammonia-lyase [Chloroflexi bacterium]|nr:threonine ammonia-lyase [Chloroflexota bacterium]